MSGGVDSLTSDSSMWIDPDDGARSGILLSDRIAFYCGRIGLVQPFAEQQLGPASYDLTVGSECWYADHAEDTGDAKRILTPGERLVIEPNSIVYISSNEVLNLPFYIVGHFNLKLRLLHTGLLVGTGPQIDPGYAGRLSCPLHNISSSKVSLTCGETFAVLEFQKTTPFAQSETWGSSDTIEQIRLAGETRRLKGLNDYPCLTFPSRSLNREPVRRYVPAGRLVTSSMQGLVRRFESLETATRAQIIEITGTLRSLNFSLYLTVAVVAVTLGTYFMGLANIYRTHIDMSGQTLERVRSTEADRDRLRHQIEDLENRIQALERSGARMSDQPAVKGPQAPVEVPKEK